MRRWACDVEQQRSFWRPFQKKDRPCPGRSCSREQNRPGDAPGLQIENTVRSMGGTTPVEPTKNNTPADSPEMADQRVKGARVKMGRTAGMLSRVPVTLSSAVVGGDPKDEKAQGKKESPGPSHENRGLGDRQRCYRSRRVGAHLAVSAPPGTVRAPLDAYGSTSDNAEMAHFQRGQPRVAPESEFGVTYDTDDLRSFLELR